MLSAVYAVVVCLCVCHTPVLYQKFENLRLQTAAILKIKKVISCMSNFNKILHGGVDLIFGLQTLGRYGKDGEDGDLK